MKIPQETDRFHFFNANPKNRKGGDCVARAVAGATGKSWETVIREMTETGIKHGYVFNDVKTINQYLEDQGYPKQAQPRKRDGTKYTGEEFCELLDEAPWIAGGYSIVANIGGHHTVCIRRHDGMYKVWDIWNSTGGCIGNYWIVKD